MSLDLIEYLLLFAGAVIKFNGIPKNIYKRLIIYISYSSSFMLIKQI